MTVASFTPETFPSLQTAFNLQHHQLLLISQLRNLLLNTTTCFTDTGEQQAYAFHELSEGTVKVRSISSRLWVNIENSRRFKALPLTVGLLSLGKDGYRGFSDDTFLQTLSLATSSLHGEQQSASFNHPSYLLPALSSNIDSGAFLALLHLCLKKSDVRYRKTRDLYGLIIESP
ncbi:hypothetical protein AYX14_05080 [Cryptococcus neoformans]|nr:hypothetical protein AYX14_05080 [Cryptococcus neoformans var. grubii]